MKILAFETTSHVASVAVLSDEMLLGEFTINHPKTHSQKLMPMLIMLLESLELNVKDFDYFAVSSGPGSFTGVRIGVSTVKALAQPHNIPVIPVSSLEAMGQPFIGFEGLICPIMDARKNEVYTALYLWQDRELVMVEPDQAIAPDLWLEQLKERTERILLVGDALPKYAAQYKDVLDKRLIIAPEAFNRQRASSVAQSALSKTHLAVSYNVVPTEYLRKSEAETTYDAKHGK
jgi:tRNA threonylcarbamoyladenosine biosynthesis protein TsaB